MKPKMEMSGLDARGASPHLRGMAERNDPRKPKDPREAKLAEALRANLRRRKAGAVPVPAQNPHKPSTD